MIAVRMSPVEIWVGIGVAQVVGLEMTQGRGTLMPSRGDSDFRRLAVGN